MEIDLWVIVGQGQQFGWYVVFGMVCVQQYVGYYCYFGGIVGYIGSGCFGDCRCGKFQIVMVYDVVFGMILYQCDQCFEFLQGIGIVVVVVGDYDG